MIATAAALTDAQRSAVAHAEGPLLIIAGAGTGKTRVLVERYRRLRQEGVPAEQILLLTFTEKAAREVLDRVEQEDYLPAGERFVLTYHAFAQRFLQEEGWLCGIPKAFHIVSEVRKWELMRDVLLELRPPHLFHAQRPYERIGELLKLVERAKQELVSPVEFRTWADANARLDDPVLAAQREAALVYGEYQDRLLAEERLDFDDTIYFSVQLLTQEPSVAARQSRRFTHLMVDEFQDTNFAQSRLLELLAGTERNLCVVGDDDQSIYKFRGASVANLRRFHAVFPDTAVIRLEDNYRSRGPILRAAGRLISEDPDRLEKKPRRPTPSPTLSKPRSTKGGTDRTRSPFCCGPMRTCTTSRGHCSARASPTRSAVGAASINSRRSRIAWPTCVGLTALTTPSA